MRCSDTGKSARAARSDAAPILIVADDDEGIRSLLDSLAGDRAPVSVVRSADAALRASSELQPGVVVIAMALSDDAAIELAAEFKRVGSEPRVVMLEVLSSSTAALTDRHSPIDDVIPAGTTHELLVYRIRAALQQYIQDTDRRDRLKELLLLEELSRLGASDIDLDAALSRVTRRLVDLPGVDIAAIRRFDTRRVFCATRRQPDDATGSDVTEIETLVTGLCDRRPDDPAGVDPCRLDPHLADSARRLGLQVILPLPLTIDAQPWGTLLVGRRDANAFTRRQAARLDHVAHLVVAMVERSARRADVRSRDTLVHDLMQPVTAALAMLEMLVADEELSPTGQMLAESMQRALNRIGPATSSSPSWSTPDAEAAAPVDVRRVIVDAAGLVEHDYARQGLVLVRRLAPVLPPVRGDAVGIERILVNLLVNAREAMVGRRGTVLLTAARVRSGDGEYVELRVRDHGPGIAPEIRDRLFEPYCSTKGQNRQRGLGLSSCREIVEQVGGSICAEPVDGEGACFRVLLPAIRSLAAVGVSSPVSRGSGAAPRFQRAEQLCKAGTASSTALIPVAVGAGQTRRRTG